MIKIQKEKKKKTVKWKEEQKGSNIVVKKKQHRWGEIVEARACRTQKCWKASIWPH